MLLQCDNYKPDTTQMASSSFLFLLATLLLTTTTITATNSSSPKPTPWPLQFHSILFVNYTNSLSLIDLWYDWPNGRNYNIIQDQLGDGILYDAEWNNGSIFTFHKDREYCRTAEIDVGILRPDWMDGADYVGREMVDGFVCNVWEKVGFILYYEDVVTNRPVHWVFYTGRSIHVMTFEVGAVLEDVVWQAPAYCFQGNDTKIGGLESGYRKNVGYLEPPVKTI